MSRIPQPFLDELLTRTDIVSIVESHIALKKAGASYKACCPFHKEKTPSFVVTPSKQMYHCFGCGAGGNAIGFLMDYDHLTFREAVESLAQQCGLTIPVDDDQRTTISSNQEDTKDIYTVLLLASQFYQKQLRQHPQKMLAIDYLKSRGLSGEVCKQFAIGYAPPGWDNLLRHCEHSEAIQDTEQNPGLPRRYAPRNDANGAFLKAGLLIKKDNGEAYDRFRNRVMFPIRDRRGRTIGFGGRIIDPKDEPKYLNSPETPVFQKRTTLYGLYEILQNRKPITQLMIVEGYMDVVALAQFGIHYAVATLGTATTAEHIQLLLRHTDHLIFCFDGDNAGRAAAWKALQSALPYLEDNVRAEFLFLPSGDDPDSLVRREGQEGFEERLAKATSFSSYFFDHLSEVVNLRELDGQAKLAHMAAPLIKQIPGPLFRYKLLEALSESSQIDLSDLSKMLGLDLRKNAPPLESLGRRDQRQYSLMQQAISLLLQHPLLASEIKDLTPFTTLNRPGALIFLNLLELLKKAPHLTTASLIENWRDKTDFQHLQKLANREILINSEKINSEFNAILEKLMTEDEEQLIMSLQNKADKNTLTIAEKKQYLQLLSKRHEKSETP
jgi:DNA primase